MLLPFVKIIFFPVRILIELNNASSFSFELTWIRSIDFESLKMFHHIIISFVSFSINELKSNAINESLMYSFIRVHISSNSFLISMLVDAPPVWFLNPKYRLSKMINYNYWLLI